MTLNINLIAGPGIGKTVLMCELFAALKRRGVHCEFVPEYAKELQYDGVLQTTPQDAIFQEQYRRLLRVQGKAEVVVTDSALPLSLVYRDKASRAEAEPVVRGLIEGWNAINVLLYRDLDLGYEPQGRYQSKDEAKDFHATAVAPYIRGFFGSDLVELHVNEALEYLTDAALRQVRPRGAYD